MKKPAWKSIVDNLKQGEGKKHSYSEKLPATALHGAQESIQREVVQEMGAALKRAGEKIEEALLDLDELDEAIKVEGNPERRHRLIDAFNERRRDALRARRNYIIQREAIGFFHHGPVMEQYPIPGKRVLPVGPHGEDGTVEGMGVCDE